MLLASPGAYAQGKWVKLTLSPGPAEGIGGKKRDEISGGHRPCLMVPIGSSCIVPRATRKRIVRPWWVALELGDGQHKLASDQFNTTGHPAFALGFAGGHGLAVPFRSGLFQTIISLEPPC